MYFKITFRLTILFAWIMLIMVLLLTPMPFSIATGEMTYYDKITHAMLFGVMAFFVYYLLVGIKEQESLTTKGVLKHNKLIEQITTMRIFTLSFLFSFGYSMLLEHFQKYISGRSSNAYDFFASVIGIILVLIFVYGDNYSKKT